MFIKPINISREIFRVINPNPEISLHSIFNNSINIKIDETIVNIGFREELLPTYGILVNKDEFLVLKSTIECGMVDFKIIGKSISIGSNTIDLEQSKNIYDSSIGGAGPGIDGPIIRRIIDYIKLKDKKNGFNISNDIIIDFPWKEDIGEKCKMNNMESEFYLKLSLLSRFFLDDGDEDILKYFIGRGQGLTPSGDDFLVGMLSVFFSLNLFEKSIEKLENLILKNKGLYTNDISEQFLLLATKGKFSMNIIEINKMVSIKKYDIITVDNIIGYGNTSGIDTILGIIFAYNLSNQRIGDVSMKKIMIALGGNALGNNPKEQLELVKETAKPIVDLIEEGHTVVLAHGNGPQVGMINLAFETATGVNQGIPAMPFPECGAMSQGYIGYHLQNAILLELRKRNIDKSVVSLVTQVIVDENDKAFDKPSKPIGSFYTKEEADELSKAKGYTMIEDSGRGYRRVVPSPRPVDIVEKQVINDLVDKGHVVIAVGGGGIPTIEKDGELVGVTAVIDKDLASEKLAELLDCDTLFILTAVEKVAVNFGKPNQVNLDKITVEEAYKYIDEGQFAPGSMLPKVEAAIDFVISKENRETIITSLENAKRAINGETGTVICN